MSDKLRTIFRSQDMEISRNVEGFKWPTLEEKIAGLLDAGLIDQAEADRLRAKFAARLSPATPA